MKKLLSLLLAAILLTSCGGSPNTPAATDISSTEFGGAGRETADAADVAATTEEATSAETVVTEGATETAPDTDPAHTTAPVYPAGEYEPVVFMYHLILDEPYSVYENLFVRPSELEAQIGVLDSLGYDYAFAEEYGVKDRPTAILTFDDGYLDNYTEMFPILKRTGAKATVFLVKSLVGTDGYLTEDQIREMSRSGLVSFQTHTVSHLELAAMSPDRIAREMEESIEYIEGLTGKEVTALAYPAGRYSDAALAEVAKYVDFAYTTESPSAVDVGNPLLIPRWRIPRGYSVTAFENIVK